MINEQVGKPPRVRKLEFLLRDAYEKFKETEECTTEWYQLYHRINGFRNEYFAITGKAYQSQDVPQ